MTTSRDRSTRGARAGYFSFLREHPRFLGFGFALTLFSSFGQTYFLSTFGEPIRAAFDLSAGDWGLRYGIATAASAFTLMWVGRWIDLWDLKRWTTAVLLGLTAACLLMASIPNAIVLVLALFGMRLAGQGLMGHTATTSMARYYEAERGRALTIAGLGLALGFSVFPRLGVWLQATVDWRVAWLILAGVTAVLILPLARILLRGHGARHARWLESVQSEAVAASAGTGHGRHQWTRAEVLGDWRFYVLMPGVLACPCVMTGMIFFHDDLASAKGWSREYLSTAMVSVGIALYVTSIVLGPIVDRMGPRRLVALTQLPLAAGLFIVAYTNHATTAYLYLLAAGMTMGSMGPVIGSLWPRLYGTQHLGSIRALVSSAMALSTSAAPWLFGKLIDRDVDMAQVAWGSGIYVLIGTMLLALATQRPPPGGHQGRGSALT